MSVVTAAIRLLLLGFALVLLACSDPRDTTIPTDPARWDTDLRPITDRLSQDDRRLVSAYVARKRAEAAQTGAALPSGVTVRQAIQEERDYQQADTARRVASREQQDQQDRVRRDYEAQVKAILPMTLVAKQVAPPDLSTGSRAERATLVLELRNVGLRDIAAFRGTLRLSDNFQGVSLRTLQVSYEEPIAAGASVQWEVLALLDPFITTDLRLKNTDVPQIAVTLLPEFIGFTDGTRLEMPAGLNR
jgi:hypothetical protein